MKPVFKVMLKLLLSVAALYYVFTKIDIQQVFAIFRNVNYLLLLIASLFFIISKLISAWRLNYFFDSIGIKLDQSSNIRLYLLGMYYNLFLPGGIGGDGYKVYLLNKKFGRKVKDLFWSVMLDRINGVFILFILALLFSPILPIPALHVILILSSIPVSIIVYFLIHKYLFKIFYSNLKSISLLSLGVQVMQLFSALFILYANNAYNNIPDYLFIFLVSSIVAALPITIGGIGSREITFLFGAKLLQLDINLSIALSLLFYFITLLVSLVGAYYSINSEALKLKEASN